MVDVTALAGAVPSAVRRTPAKKEATKKEAPVHAAGKAAAPVAKRAGRTAK